MPLPVRPVEAGRHLLAGGRKAVTHERGPLVPGGLGTRSRRASFQLLHWRGERQGENLLKISPDSMTDYFSSMFTVVSTGDPYFAFAT